MKQLVGITLVIFLLSVSFASAQKDIIMDVYPMEIAVEVGEPAKFVVTTYSPETEGGLYLFVSGNPSHWINMGTSYIDLPMDGPLDILVEFYPNDVPGSYDYELVVQSLTDPELKLSEVVKLIVIGSEGVGEVENSVTIDDENINIMLALESDVEESVTADFSLVSDSGKIVSTYTRTFILEGRTNITHRIPLTDAPFSDTYTLKVSVKDTDISFEKSFMIDPIHKVVKKEEGSLNPLFEEYRIEVSNKGNVIEEDYRITASVPTGFVVFSRQPDNCEEGECEWVIPKLNPQEDLQIVYSIQYWPLIAEGLLIAVLLGVFVLFGWNRLNVPSFRKRLESRSDGSYTAVLEIKNAGRKITNVVIKDEVSPLFKVKDGFETVKPAVRRHEDATELVWSLPAIEPGDQRIIHYRMSPVVKGHLKVPKAYMRYSTEGGKKSKVATRELHLAA